MIDDAHVDKLREHPHDMQAEAGLRANRCPHLLVFSAAAPRPEATQELLPAGVRTWR